MSHAHDAGILLRAGAVGVGTAAPVGSFQIVHDSGEPIVTIYLDGRVEVNPAFTVDDAARAFWEAVKQLNPGDGGRIGE